MLKIIFVFVLLSLSSIKTFDDGVTIESDQPEEPTHPKPHKKDVSLNREINNLLKSYIKNLKKNQEIVISSGTGFSADSRFKTGDIHIKKADGLNKSPEVTETQTKKYVFPYGIGAFLMSGCYRMTGIPSKTHEADSRDDQTESKRRKRETNSSRDEHSFTNYCKKYAFTEKTKNCEKMIQGAYALGAGFDIKFENNENSRRKTIIKKYCNYAKKFNEYSVPDPITANGIYDTTTQTMAFGSSDEYMKHLASRSNLDRYSNIFVADKKSVYGGIMGHKLGELGTGLGFDKGKKGSLEEEKIVKYSQQTDSYLFMISSSILIYDLILDQITPWNIDPDFLSDFIGLPQSYFYPNAAAEFEKFISRYGTHVVVSAKFGGEFKVIHTMQKSKVDSLEQFSQKCTTDALSMFSRSFHGNVNFKFGTGDATYSGLTSNTEHEEGSTQKQNSNKRMSEYTSTYISVKGGSQEVAAVVANMNQPDFGETFSSWLSTVHTFPRAFDFKFESIASVLDIDVKQLFSLSSTDIDEKLCRETNFIKCEFGSTVSEFEDIWRRKLKALKFAITLYLKEKSGLTTTKLTVKKGDSDCRFNILNYLAPYWKEIVTSDQEYRISLSMNLNDEILDFHKNDEILFMKREDFWLAKRKGDKYSYQSAQRIGEPFRKLNGTYLSVFGLMLEYNENDATVTVTDMKKVLREYSYITDCDFDYRFVNMTDEYGIQYVRPFVYLTYDPSDEYGQLEKRSLFDRDNYFIRCGALLKYINWNSDKIRNYLPYWSKLWGRVIGVVDYLDPIQSVRRTWDLPFAVIPCQLKWSNNLMIVLPTNEDGKCLKFTAASRGEIFVVIASTPSNQKSWYTFQITTKGVVFYRAGKATLLHDESTAGSTGDENLYQNFFICLNYEVRRLDGKNLRGLSIQYGIHIDSNELGHLYLSYFDIDPLDPSFYSFGSRNADVEILNAHIVSLTIDEQVKLRCPSMSKFTKSTSIVCDYRCHSACDGCSKPFSDRYCKQCAFASVAFNYTVDGIQKDHICVVECPKGYHAVDRICIDINECALNTHECQSNTYCVNTQGSYECTCKDGFKGNHHFCNDINECELGLDNCHSKAICTNLYGSFSCSCAPGFTGNGTFCFDINECEAGSHDCKWNMKCLNQIGSYDCICDHGLIKADENCIDIDECLAGNHTCFEKNAQCFNTYGSYECVCQKGYRFYQSFCVDINECHLQACSQNEICVNYDGSFECLCKEYFEKTYYTNKCKDIDECSDSYFNNCDLSNSVCKNTHGSYECECLNGYYKLNDTCIDIDECFLGLHSCKYPFVCVNLDGSYECKCAKGFFGEKCEDIDECESNPCGIQEGCVNKHGSFECISTEFCRTGFIGALTTDGVYLCKDVDECSKEYACVSNSVCINEIGSYKCECIPGYWMDSTGKCIDIDECSRSCLNTCNSKTSYCVNEPGSYYCECRFGFEKKEDSCFDVNECSLYSDICGLSQCINTEGSYFCECDKGFYLNNLKCEDMNECVLYSNYLLNCPDNSECINTFGSYACQCRVGFKLENSSCIDIDECLSYNCPPHSICKNTLGSFTCSCNSGFEMMDGVCKDINECEIDALACDNHAYCVNRFGSFECSCEEGWRKNVFDLCEDIDECKEGTHVCTSNSYCHNTPGSYDCHCRDGFYEDIHNQCVDVNECLINDICKNETKKCVNKNGSYDCVCKEGLNQQIDGTCVDINECDQNPCDDYSQCINTFGSYECKCFNGYHHLGETMQCIDTDECDIINPLHACSQYAICKNNIGSYSCSCKSGFIGNGTYCEDIDECKSVKEPNEVFCNSTGTCFNTIGYYRCECLSGYTNVNNNCIDIDECLYESCFSKSTVNGDLCYAFGVCKNIPGSFLCECLEGFEYNTKLGQCVDIDECNRIQNGIVSSDICVKDSSHVAQCINQCGNFSCECKDTNLTIVDFYDSSKCYKRNEVRDFSLNIFIDRSKFNFFYKKLKFSFKSCKNKEIDNDSLSKHEFYIQMEPFHEILSEFKNNYFFPLLIDNRNWSIIEFVCEIKMNMKTLQQEIHSLESYKFILLEDITRNRCYLYESINIQNINITSEITYGLGKNKFLLMKLSKF